MYTTLPPLQALPEFLEETAYANPSELHHSPFQKAFNTNMSKFEWQANEPELGEAFGLWMAAQHTRHMTWLTVLNFTDFVRASAPETPVFVDVGGGIGHQCALLKEHVPDLVGKVVLQDSASVIQRALPTPGVEKMAYDFWKAQPIKGKKAHDSEAPTKVAIKVSAAHT